MAYGGRYGGRFDESPGFFESLVGQMLETAKISEGQWRGDRIRKQEQERQDKRQQFEDDAKMYGEGFERVSELPPVPTAQVPGKGAMLTIPTAPPPPTPVKIGDYTKVRFSDKELATQKDAKTQGYHTRLIAARLLGDKEGEKRIMEEMAPQDISMPDDAARLAYSREPGVASQGLTFEERMKLADHQAKLREDAKKNELPKLPYVPAPVLVTGPGGKTFRVPRTGGAATPVTTEDGQPLVKQDTRRESDIREAHNKLDVVTEALSLAKARPQSFGFRTLPNNAGAIGGMAVQWIDPKGVDARRAVSRLASINIKDVSGANVVAKEWPRLRPWVPNIGQDKPETVMIKLEGFAREYARVIAQLEKGYTIKQVEESHKADVASLRAKALQSIKNGKSKDAVAKRFKEMTGEDL